MEVTFADPHEGKVPTLRLGIDNRPVKYLEIVERGVMKIKTSFHIFALSYEK
jgi:hypothetical protein